jgi:hypothetical protein
MISTKRSRWACAAFAVALAAVAAQARAQEAPAPEQAAPAPVSTPTLMDREYDGKTHITVAPYIWGPTIKGVFQYSVPTLRHHAGHVAQASVAITPTDYLSKLNSAAMFALDARKGNVDVFGDFIYVNASASAAATSLITLGRADRIQIPATFSTNAHLATSIWEAAAGYTIARGHDADLSLFAGLREFPVNLTLDYNATIGRRGIIAPSGTVVSDSYLSDIIFGLRGKAFFGDGHWFVPYYADLGTGTGANNQTWEAYGGAGYAFNHGQTILATWRSLNYNSFPPDQHVQKLTMSGPLLGYTFNL